jgi:hypothetical protein
VLKKTNYLKHYIMIVICTAHPLKGLDETVVVGACVAHMEKQNECIFGC